MEYFTVQEDNLPDFDVKSNELAKYGWEPCGNIVVSFGMTHIGMGAKRSGMLYIQQWRREKPPKEA